jgi:3-isopropylmalate/(R)-2-methylmalate dehydratase small subunit
MQSYDPEFQSKVRAGDLIIGADNFGYGHPHYPPMRAMRHLGIAGVIAESFSPGYWRGEISMGFPQVSCPGILGHVQRWDDIEVDWAAGLVRNLTQKKDIAFEPLSRGDRQMLEAGGTGSVSETNICRLTGHLEDSCRKPALTSAIACAPTRPSGPPAPMTRCRPR